MRELRHPWMLVHIQDRKSRQRRTKPPRQYELSGATSQLSLGYLFCHTRVPSKDYVGSLGQTFVNAFFAVRNTLRQAFALTFISRFPTWMSLPLGPRDIFSPGCHPSQTARLLVSPLGWAVPEKMGSVTLATNLLPTLCISPSTTTTSCCKGPQGLSFPLGVTGMFTSQCVQKVLVGDSDHLVKPFMHVTIQMTRHYATLRAS
jgi:hypothetical protein